jgi:hypothetical protein
MHVCMEETLEQRRLQQDLMLAHKFIGVSIAGGENLFKKIDLTEAALGRQWIPTA